LLSRALSGLRHAFAVIELDVIRPFRLGISDRLDVTAALYLYRHRHRLVGVDLGLVDSRDNIEIAHPSRKRIRAARVRKRFNVDFDGIARAVPGSAWRKSPANGSSLSKGLF